MIRHCTAIVPHGLAPVWPPQRGHSHARRKALPYGPGTKSLPTHATALSYTLLRHLCLQLDELSAQGLTLWQDERHSWQWSWADSEVSSARGFWAVGEAILDAVVTRFPWAFDPAAIAPDG